MTLKVPVKLKYKLLDKYFIKEKDTYTINSDLKKMVIFNFYDLTNKKSMVPPDSIFGDFDIVLCRNVLIYFGKKYQELILSKINKSIKSNGLLLLGEAETIGEKLERTFIPENNYCKIFRKNL